MKAFNTVMKILAALAAVAGTVYVIATFGDKIVAWAKAMLEKYGRCGVHYFDGEEETDFVPAPQVSQEEEAPKAPAAAEETAKPEEAPAADPEQADEADFEA